MFSAGWGMQGNDTRYTSPLSGWSGGGGMDCGRQTGISKHEVAIYRNSSLEIVFRTSDTRMASVLEDEAQRYIGKELNKTPNSKFESKRTGLKDLAENLDKDLS